ncbi:MAG TPA: metal-dependent hydrolase [Ramlibacter sp.]|uniref:metal-dependent hydrolase n=1 Tax=Ramlibacter sp. TaxID=1917967 RepID=UPI002D80586F|nr:metal-dependent hydrolase [Ramlibacter sp.]HET8745862.1 metal-dependent hydrolase [Ramlibacter sp.]
MTSFRPLLCIAALCTLAGCSTPIMPPASTTLPVAPALQALPGDAPRVAGKTEILWLGQATTRITTPGGKVILIDPWIKTNPKTPARWKDLSTLGKVDLILVTHAHFDHFADAPELAKMHNAPMYGPAGLGQTVATYGILPAALAPRFGKGGTILPWGPTGPKITAVHAEHSSELGWKDAAGKDVVLPGGEPVGYIIEMENGFKVWHMGDTGVFGDMRLIGQMYRPDVVLMPIGNHFVMSPQDAAMAVRDMIRPRYAIPIHYGTTPQLRGTPAELLTAMGSATVPRILVPEPGQKYDF